MIPESFRDRKVPIHIKSKTQLIAWVLESFMEEEPISNWEFVRDLYCHRFGGILHNLRKEGYEITTLPTKTKGYVKYYCSKVPNRSTATIN